MWIYNQASGALSQDDNPPIAHGYSGAGVYKNVPEAQGRHNEGPIPRGMYTIGAPHDTQTHGPYVLRLTQDAGNDMEGRDGFLIHGDSVSRPGTASQGCIIVGRTIREQLWHSGDDRLEVI